MTRAGDERSLERLVADHLPEALRFAVRLSGDAQAAEEIVQEAIYRAVRSVGSFRGESQFRTWFYRIVVSAFRDWLAALARRGSPGALSDGLIDPRSDDPAVNAMAGELGALVATYVSGLPPRQREVMVLTAYEQLGPAEVAKVLNISESSVHANLHYARARLREQLTAYFSET